MQSAKSNVRFAAPAGLLPALQLATLLASHAFVGHLAAWRDALTSKAQACGGVVPASYLMAMRSVIASEAASATIDAEDTAAAALAIHELGSLAAAREAKMLMRELAVLGNPVAALIDALLSLSTQSRASAGAAIHQLSQLAADDEQPQTVRAAAHSLLGDAALLGLSGQRDDDWAMTHYMAAIGVGGVGAAPAHFRMANWYLQKGTADCTFTALGHLERAADAGCVRSLATLGHLHAEGDVPDADPAWGAELLEIVALGNVGLGRRAPTAPPMQARVVPHSPRQPVRTSRPRPSFVESIRGALPWPLAA